MVNFWLCESHHNNKNKDGAKKNPLRQLCRYSWVHYLPLSCSKSNSVAGSKGQGSSLLRAQN